MSERIKKISINDEWRLSKDHLNLTVERFIIKPEREFQGKSYPASQEWVSQYVYFPTEMQALRWIAKKLTDERADESIVDHMQSIIDNMGKLCEDYRSINLGV